MINCITLSGFIAFALVIHCVWIKVSSSYDLSLLVILSLPLRRLSTISRSISFSTYTETMEED